MNDLLHLSKAGLNLIKSFEGLFLTAYYCPAGVLTIGYGHTNMDGVEPRVVKGLRITTEQAEDILRRSLKKYEDAVKRLVKVRLTQSEFDALVSFAYNCGIGALEKSTLLRKLNKGDYACVPAELMKYNKATVNGKRVVLNGLTRRRKAEGTLWSLTKNIEILKPTLDGQPVAPEQDEDDEPMAQRVDPPSIPGVEQATGWLAGLSPILSLFAGIDWKIVLIITVAALLAGGGWLWYRHNNHA
jgi:lysozyme